MKNMKIYSQKNIQDRISLILEGEEEDFYRITPEDYLLLLNMSGNNPAVTKIKKFKRKPLYIDGDLNLQGLPISSLGNVIYVNGSLTLNNTNFLDIPSKEMVKGYISTYRTPYDRKIFNDGIAKKKMKNRVKRADEEWGDNDGESLRAQALYQFLIDNGDIDPLSDDEKDELETLREKLSRLEDEYKETEDDDEVIRLSDIIDEITDKIEGFEEKDGDIYDVLNILTYSYYGVGSVFELLSTASYDGGTKEYAVINSNDEDEVVNKYADEYVDSVGFDGINESILEDCIDTDAVVDMARDDYESSVRDSLDSWFDEDDYELSSEMIDRLASLESYLSELEDYLSGLQEKQSELDNEIEDPDEYSQEYDKIEEMIDETEEKISQTETEIEEINDSKEIGEHTIENKIDDLVSDAQQDPLEYLKGMGYRTRDLENFIDTQCLVNTLASSFDFSDVGSYDNSYDSVDIQGENFYVTRLT